MRIILHAVGNDTFLGSRIRVSSAELGWSSCVGRILTNPATGVIGRSVCHGRDVLESCFRLYDCSRQRDQPTVCGSALERSIALGIALALCVFSGCGSDIAEVKGRVTLDGQPLKDATVMFLPAGGGRPGTAITDADGRYELLFTGTEKGAMIGKNVVKISTYYPPMGNTGADGKTSEIPACPERLPAKYHDRTELIAEVKPGVRAYDFDLKSK